MATATDSSPKTLRVLCVEDSPDDADLVTRAMAQGPWRCEFRLVHDEDGMRQALQPVPDLVLCDFHLPRFGPVRAMALLEELGLRVPLVVVTRSIGEEAAVGILRAGAADYLTKDRLATLPHVAARVLEASAQQRRQAQLLGDLEHANRRLLDLSGRLVQAQEDERQHIARELHDSLGQALTAALVHAHAADASPDPQVGAIYRETVRKVLEQAIQQVKTLSFAMRPPQLDLLGLPATLDMLADQVLRPAGVAFEQRCVGDMASLGEQASIVAYRIVQEALSNVARHAQARRVRLRLAVRAGGRFDLTIADDGRGFDVPATLRAAPAGLRRGLLGMMERCELAGGRLCLRSRVGRGTVLHAGLRNLPAAA